MHTPSKRFSRRLSGLVAVAALAFATSAAAELIDRGGGLIYDTVLNVTWLQDANYAKTSGYHPTGLMTYKQAVGWAAGLTYRDTVRGVTYSDWRLPRTAPLNGIAFDLGSAGADGWALVNGGSDMSYWPSAPGSAYAGSTGSELAHLNFNTLGNRAYCGAPGQVGVNICSSVSPNPDNAGFGWGGTAYTFHKGPFVNFTAQEFWGGDLPTPRQLYIDRDAFTFIFSIGLQTARSNREAHSAWAVRDGDVGAPPAPPPVVTPPGNVTLSVKSAGGKGLITGSGGRISCGKVCSASLPAGSVISLTATPDAGFRFVSWTGACTGTAVTCAMSVNATGIAQANFTK